MTAPLTPADCDLRGLPYFPLDPARLKDSDLFALSTGDEFKAALALWCKAWVEVPAGSLPSDDRLLARAAGVGLTEWGVVKDMALRGWVLCDDGRFYHPTVCEKALTAWVERIGLRDRSARGQAKRHDSFIYQPEQFARMKREAVAHLERLQPGAALKMGVVLEAADMPPTGSKSVSLSSPTGKQKASEVEGEVEVEGEGEVEALSPPSGADLQISEALAAYDCAALAYDLPRIRVASPARKKKLAAILKAHGPEGWQEALSAIGQSAFLQGKRPGARGAFKASFDFLVAPSSFAKVIEGNYADSAGSPLGGGYTDLAMDMAFGEAMQ